MFLQHVLLVVCATGSISALLLKMTDTFVLSQIYLTSGKVFSLEQKINELDYQVNAVPDDAASQTMSDLEDEVARAIAQVEQTEKEVIKIEMCYCILKYS